MQCICYLFLSPTSSHADAGDVVASHLPKLKNLRKVVIWYLNPMPILLSVRLCGKLDEVIISNPSQCKVCFPELSCPDTHRTSECPGTLWTKRVPVAACMYV